MRDELSPAGGDRGRVDAQQGGNAPVAAPPALERLEPGEQTPLPLVEQAGDQHDRGAQLLRHQLGVGQRAYEPGRGQQQAPRAQLLRLLRPVGRAIQELAGELVPRQPPVTDELAEGILGADMQQVVQLLAEVSGLGVADERLGGCDQGADAGEADPGEGPQTALVEVDEFIEGVVAAAMRVAVPGGQVLELAERGAPAGAGAQRTITSGSEAMVRLWSKAMIVSAANSVGLIVAPLRVSGSVMMPQVGQGPPPRIQEMSIPIGLIAGHEGLRDGCALLRD